MLVANICFFFLPFICTGLSNPNLGGPLRVRFEVGGKITPPPSFLKLVRIMLETSSLARKFAHICSFRKYTFQYQDPLNFADVSIFSQKVSVFLIK